MNLLRKDRSRAWWLATLPLLGSQIAGWERGLDAAMALTVLQTVVELRRDRKPEALSVQVRLVYLVLLIVGSVPQARFVHVVLFVATVVQIAFGYCALARALSLMPWNRQAPLSAGLLIRTAVAPGNCEGRESAAS